ncbi:MAG: hypothetical protein HY862_07045 [Chloroflexi bacterium]|nr:hypothetical protein [Chloroflexota bacterium]
MKQHLHRILPLVCLLPLVVACRHSDTKTTPQATFTSQVNPTQTWTPVPTYTLTPSPTPSLTNTPTLTPSLTPTLATQVIEATVLMPGVEIGMGNSPENSIYSFAVPTLVEPLPNATLGTPPYYGWVTFESDNPNVQYLGGEWVKMQTERASRGQYHFSTSPDALIQFAFEGQALQVRYVGYTNGGIWEVFIDGEVRQTINGYASEATFANAGLIELAPGQHILEIRHTEWADSASSGHMVALDAIHVYQADPVHDPSPIPPTASPSPQAAEFIQLQGAPTLQPTATNQPPAVAQVTIVVAYDENANRSVEPAEGIRGIPVRLVEVGTNRVIAQAFTDETGFASLQAISRGDLRLVVPYFGAYWSVSTGVQAFSLLIPPGHQPGLIP